MKKGKARQHFLRSTRLDSEKSGQDLSFLDEGQESLPDKVVLKIHLQKVSTKTLLILKTPIYRLVAMTLEQEVDNS
jgi:hypothetical protein